MRVRDRRNAICAIACGVHNSAERKEFMSMLSEERRKRVEKVARPAEPRSSLASEVAADNAEAALRAVESARLHQDDNADDQNIYLGIDEAIAQQPLLQQELLRQQSERSSGRTQRRRRNLAQDFAQHVRREQERQGPH